TLVERPRAEWITVPAPAIIDRSPFETVAANQRRNKEAFSGRPSRRYLLRGLLWCGKCGLRMKGDPNHGAPSYRCTGRDGLRLAGERCLAKANTQRLDAAVWKAVSEPFQDPDRLRGIIQQNQAALRPSEKVKASQLMKQIERLSSREARAVKALLDASLAAQTDLIRRELTETGDHRRKLERQLAELKPTP